LPAGRLHVKPNFVHPVPEAGAGEGGYALFVGRLSPEKGVDVLLKAWSRFPDAIGLRIVGDGPLADRVRQAAAADPRIEWLGRLPSDEVLRVMSRAGCLVMPSTWYEVCPKTLLESLAVGTPVLASRLGAMVEFIEDGLTGCHFTPGNPQDLALQLQRMLGNRYTLAAMRQAARQEFLAKYTAERNYARLMEIYRAALGQPAVSRCDEPNPEPVLST
jgi:glycosyltransferase involved in cell wall biosynthesis